MKELLFTMNARISPPAANDLHGLPKYLTENFFHDGLNTDSIGLTLPAGKVFALVGNLEEVSHMDF
jgi:hypothetical protein